MARPRTASGEATKEDWFMVGTVAEIEEWLQGERAKLRFIFYTFLEIISLKLAAAEAERWASIVTLDVNHAMRYYIA